MSGESDSGDRPLTRREAAAAGRASRDAAPVQGGDPEDVATPVRGVPAAPAGGANDFDPSRVPPRPPLPAETGLSTEAAVPADAARDTRGGLGTADHTAIRDQWRARRDDFESHVSHARDQFETQISQARGQFEQANERIKQRTGRDLIVAILIGVAFGGVLIASLLFFKWLFVPIALAAGLLATYELSRALRAGGRRIDIIPQLVAGATVLLTGYFADLWLSWVMLFAAVSFVSVWRMVAQMVAKDGRTYGDVLADVTVGAFVQVYVPFLTSVALMLLSRDQGEWWVLSFVAVAVCADTFAYIAGLSFGKHPMAPRISPKKTWEGFGGAVLGSLAAGVLLALFVLHLPWWAGLIFGAAILLSATLGDLGESMLKRDLGIKDMSSWLPGHGGLLDRLDSILPSTIPALALSYLLAPWISA